MLLDKIPASVRDQIEEQLKPVAAPTPAPTVNEDPAVVTYRKEGPIVTTVFAYRWQSAPVFPHLRLGRFSRGIPSGQCHLCKVSPPFRTIPYQGDKGHEHLVPVPPQYGGIRYEINRTALCDRDGWICGICDLPIAKGCPGRFPWAPSIDHIIPKSKGGLNVESNLQAAHLRCNVLKGARNITKIRWPRGMGPMPYSVVK